MKDYSAAQIKASVKRRGKCRPLEPYPREGTKIRELFDLFVEFRGQIIDFGHEGRKYDHQLATRIKYLQDMYGMNITHLHLGKWCYRGEYIGGKYVAYDNDKPLNIKMKPKT